MKYLALLLFFNFNLAHSAVLSPAEATEVANYLDNICPDTYCGGDLNYYANKMACEKDSCVLDMTVYGDQDGFKDSLINTLRTFESTRIQTTTTVKSVGFKVEQCSDFETNEQYECHIPEVKFQCAFNAVKIPEEMSADDYFYTRLLDECLVDLEELIYNSIYESEAHSNNS